MESQPTGTSNATTRLTAIAYLKSQSERTYRCERCGLIIDRDVNAARNPLKLAGSGPENRNACGGTVRPRPARHVPLKQEPGAAHAGKTGTAFPQGEAAA